MRRLFPATLTAFACIALAFSCVKQEEEEKPGPDVPDPEPQTETPVIQAEPAAFAAAAGTYDLAVKVEHPAEGASLSAKLADPAPDWIAVGAPASDGIPVTLKDNLSAARSATMVISYPNAEDVSVELTQQQWIYSEFEIAISNLGPFGATFNIKRKPGYSGGYFFEVLDKESFNKYVESEKNKIGDFAYGEALYQSDVSYLKRLAEHHGHALKDLFTMLPSMYSKDAEASIPYKGLAVDTDYIFIVYGMEDSDQATRKTAMCFYEFKTAYSSESALTFTGVATDITENYAEITVTPSNNNEYWYLDWISDIKLKSTTLGEVMQNSIDRAKTLLSRYRADQILCHGEETVQASDLIAGTEYTVVAWGMDLDMNATTEPQAVFTFKTKEFEIVDDCTFDIEILEIEDMDVKVRVTPSNQTTRYYVAFVDFAKMEGYSDEQAAQRIINMEAQRIENHYYDVENLSWANLPGLEAGTREIWGRRDEGWTFQPRHDYHIYVFGIDNFGIRSTGVARKDVTTAESTPSHNHFSVTIDAATWQGIDYTVTPEILDEYWMPFFIETAELDYFRNIDGSLKEKEIMEQIEEYYEDEILYNTYTGTRTLHAHVTPDTEYSILVFGYSGSYTTKMYEWKVYAPKPPLGKSTADYSYTYELFRGEDLADIDPRTWPHADYDGDCIMVVRLTPTENAVHWYWGIWPPKENFEESGGQYYLMTLDMNPTVSAVDKKSFRFRPWWYGASEGWQWVDEEGDIVNHWPWTISGFAEDADGNYGLWHYDYLIPVPVPKGQETGKYEVGYTQAYDFWSAPASNMKIYNVSNGKEIGF